MPLCCLEGCDYILAPLPYLPPLKPGLNPQRPAFALEQTLKPDPSALRSRSMDFFFQPVTRLCEIFWCATQVSGQYVEVITFGVVLVGFVGLSLQILQWQKKIMTMLYAAQVTLQEVQSQQLYLQQDYCTQVQDLSFAHEKLEAKIEDNRVLLETLTAMYQEANECTKALQTLLTGDGSSSDAGSTPVEDSKQIKVQLLEIVAKLGTLQGMHTEVAAIHKLLNNHTGDWGKIGVAVNRSTESHALLLQLNGEMATGKNLTDQLDKLQKGLDRKLEDLLEKQAVVRALMDQHRDKVVGVVKDNTGWISKNVSDVLSLLRTVTPAQHKMMEMLSQGREASQLAQNTLLACAETVQTCEDRLVRVESLATGLVDGQNELDSSTKQAFEQILSELPTLQEVLSRLPKLPQRKPPAEKAPEAATTAQQPQHPTTPPTTLGPPQPSQPTTSQVQPTVIPVSLDSGLQSPGGIQLRLSEHVGAVATQTPQLVLGGNVAQESRAPNFLITPIPAPAQAASSGDLLRAMFRQ